MAETRRQGAPRDPRVFAHEALQRVEEGDFSDAVVGTGLVDSPMEPRDRALATRLVYGTLAWQGHIDHILTAFSQRPLADVDPRVRTLLRLATYQICHLTRIPAFAAVDTAVNLAKRSDHKSDRRASGFVNAVLRKVASQWQQVPLPDREQNRTAHLSVRYSHPEWLVKRWLREFGEDHTERLIVADNETAPTVVRVNRRAISRDELVAAWQARGLEASATRWSKDGIRLDGADSVGRLGNEDASHFTPQGEASQLVGQLVDPQPGERILDLCAAPGGKTTHLAERMDDTGKVVAVDYSAAGIDRVRSEAQRLGLSIVEGVVANGTRWEPTPADSDRDAVRVFDRVLVDAPCTGLGTLRQHPEIRWRRGESDVTRNAALQKRLLERATKLLRPGGILVYATCTLTRDENEAHIERLLKGRHFELEPADRVLGSAARELIDEQGYLRTFPDRDGLDGFFAARLKRV